MIGVLRVLIGAAVVFSVAGAAGAASSDSTSTQPMAQAIEQNPDPARYLFEDKVLPGMKGYGLTVMHGGKIERFDVEVIDVVRNFSPGNNAILVRCSGLGLEHSGIIAGMSGSPVFIDGKMIGAVAYGWGMSKDAIGGVQPIRQMLAIRADRGPSEGRQSNGGSRGGRWSTDSYFAKEAAALPGWKTVAASLRRRGGGSGSLMKNGVGGSESLATGAVPLLSPLMVGGASAGTVATLREALAGTTLFPLARGSAGATADLSGERSELGGLGDVHAGEIRLEPGSAIAVPLVTGDMDLSAIGTVTEVRDGKVYAFGHAFMGEGASPLPIATSYIYTVVPNVNVSFKMGTSIATTGSLVTDEQTGIVGVEGKSSIPPTVPITFAVKHADGTVDNTFHYQLSPHPHLTPELLTAIVGESLMSHRALPNEYTAHLTGELRFHSSAGPRTIKLDSLGTNESFNPEIALLPVAMLSDNPFENLKLTGVSLEATVEGKSRSGEIMSVTLDRLSAEPGDTLTAMVEIKPFQKAAMSVPMTIKIPEGTADGDYELSVGSAAMALVEEAGYAPQRFDPRDIAGLERAIQHLLDYRHDRLYATLVLNISGAAVGGHEHGGLPGSRLALFASERRNDATPVFDVVQSEMTVGQVIADGGQTFTVHVDRHADERYFEGSSDHSAAGPGLGMLKATRVPTTAPPPASAPAGDPGG